MKPLCPCCSSDAFLAKGTFRGYTHLVCQGCGYERFDGNETIQASDYEDDPDYLDDIIVYPLADDRIQWHHEKAIRFIEGLSNPHLEILDVGCFDGFFVRKLCDNGFDAQGVDFNRKAIAGGIDRFGLQDRISNKSVAQLHSEGKRFNVVTMFEVIEHLESFEQVLADCVALLKPGGYLILSTPNCKMTWRPPLDYPPHHLSRFTPASLKGLAANNGLDAIQSLEQSSSFDLFRHYIGLKFRQKDTESMRGGEFKNRSLVDPLRQTATRLRRLIYLSLKPIDRFLHAMGFRYIGQLMIAQKNQY